MTERYADLHIHSCYSDSTMTPREILDAAKARGLSLIAIADHYRLEGSRQLKELCRAEGMGYLSAAELDSLDEGHDIHILGYGMDLEDEAFRRFVRRGRDLLDHISVILLERMRADYPTVSPEELAAFTYDPRLGGWKALHYLLHKGISENLKDGYRFYKLYDCPFSIVDFPSVAETCRAVRAAGGRAVLAHPGETLGGADIQRFVNELNRVLDMGLDGAECYYPKHNEEVTQICLNACNERKLLITCGSDCHGGFGRMSIGEILVPMGKLKLGDLI